MGVSPTFISKNVLGARFLDAVQRIEVTFIMAKMGVLEVMPGETLGRPPM